MTETDKKVVIPTAKVHKMLKQLGIARCSVDSAEVCAKFINEQVAELGEKAFKYTQSGSRSTISDKDMLNACKDKNPNFTFTLKE